MNRNLLTVLIIAAAGILIIFWYPSYQKKNEEKAELALESKVSELSRIVLEERDCARAVEEASAFLKVNPGAENVWSILGACQFDLGRFDDARASFENVLALNPDNEGAQNYLKQMEFKDGEVVVTSAETYIGQARFESAMGLNFSNILTFVVATEKPSNIPEYLFAHYTADRSLDTVVASLESLLEGTGADFNLSRSGTSAIFSYGDEKERKIIVLDRIGNSSVTANMNYQKLAN